MALSLREQVLRRKPVAAMNEDSGTDSGGGELSRSIGLFQLSMFGIGATIGTGIFIVLTQAVPVAGPAVIWSFVIAGTVAGLTAICYAELASAVPVSGSSYSYAYATLGEGVAVVVAACLLLEYGVAAAAVAVGWSQYLNQLLDNLFGFRIPENLSNAPEADGILNLPAVVLIVLCTLLLIRGASESAKANAVMVVIKLSVLVLFIAVGLQGWDSDNLSDFSPFGLDGVTSAAGIIFFSYIGLDAVSTAGEEVKNPRRTMPLAIIIALVTVTTIYIAVAVVAVAAQPMAEFEGQEAGLAAILEDVTGASWPSTVLAAGAVISIFSVTLVSIYGQTRILFAMGRDGMIPSIFRRVNPRTLTPVPATIIVAVHRLAAGRGAADRVPGRDDEHRHAGRVPGRLGRRDGAAPDGAGPQARLQGARLPGHAAAVDRGLHLDHPGPARGHDLGLLRLGRGRAAVVLHLRHPPLRAGAGAMTLLVGVAPERRGRAVLDLAAMLARTDGDDLLVTSIVPAPWAPGPARVDAEYQAELQRLAQTALDDARQRLPEGARYLVHHARSVPSGLLEVAERNDARMIVLGSAISGALGYVASRQHHRPARALLADPARARAARVPLPLATAR